MACESFIKLVVGGTGSELVGLHVNKVITRESFTMSRSELVLGEVSHCQ